MKKFLFFMLAAAAGMAFCANAWAEEMTLVTYYPAPFGMYQEMRVMGQLGVGISDVEDDSRMQVVAEDGGAYKTVAKFVQGDDSNGSYGVVIQQGADQPGKLERGALFVTGTGNAAIFEASNPHATKNVFLSRTSIGENSNPDGKYQLYVNTDRGNVLIKEKELGEGQNDNTPVFAVIDGQGSYALQNEPPIGLFVSQNARRGTALAAVSKPGVSPVLPGGQYGIYAVGITGAGLFQGNVTINPDAGGTPGNLIMGQDGGNIRLNNNWLSGDGQDEGVYVLSSGAVGINTSAPGNTLGVDPGGVQGGGIAILSNDDDVQWAGLHLRERGNPDTGFQIVRRGHQLFFYSRYALKESLKINDQGGVTMQIAQVDGAVCDANSAGQIRFKARAQWPGPGAIEGSVLRICTYRSDQGQQWQWRDIFGAFTPATMDNGMYDKFGVAGQAFPPPEE